MGITQDTGRQTAAIARRADRTPGSGRWWRLASLVALGLGLVVPAARKSQESEPLRKSANGGYRSGRRRGFGVSFERAHHGSA